MVSPGGLEGKLPTVANDFFYLPVASCITWLCVMLVARDAGRGAGMTQGRGAGMLSRSQGC